MPDFNIYPALDYRPIDFNQIPMSNALLQQQKNSNALFPLELQARQRINQQSKDDYAKQQLLTAAQQIDDTDPDTASRQWDANMARAAKAIEASGGDPNFTKQWIGKYSADRRANIGKAYGGAQVGSPGSPGGPQVSGGRGGNALAGNPYMLSPNQQEQMRLSGLGQLPEQTTPGGQAFDPTTGQNFNLPGLTVTGQQGQLQGYQQKMAMVADELDRVLGSSNPAATWAQIQTQDPEAAKIGPYDADKFMQMRDHMRAALTQGGNQMFGAPAERPVPQIEKGAQGEITQVDSGANPFAPTAKQLMPPTFRPDAPEKPNYIGTDEAGHPVTLATGANGKAELTTHKDTVLSRGRYLTAGGGKTPSTKEEREAARWAVIHQNDPEYVDNPGKRDEDAMQWARGLFNRPAKDMSDTEIDIKAAQASFGDPQAEARLRAEFRADRDADRKRAGSVSGPKSAPGPALHNGPTQLHNSPMVGGATPDSDIAKPTTAAEFDKLPVGKKFINPADGKVWVKTK